MAERPERRPALAGIHRLGNFGASGQGGPGVVLTLRIGLTLIHLAGRPDRASFLAAVGEALSLDLPLEPDAVVRGAGVTVFALAPTRWLVASESIPVEAVEARLSRAVAGSGAFTDVSGGRMVVRIGGTKARAVLAKDCPLDLHPRVFRPGRCAQSVLAGVSVLLHALEDGQRFDLYVARSYDLHFWEWLTDAAAEFGYRVTPYEEGPPHEEVADPESAGPRQAPRSIP